MPHRIVSVRRTGVCQTDEASTVCASRDCAIEKKSERSSGAIYCRYCQATQSPNQLVCKWKIRTEDRTFTRSCTTASQPRQRVLMLYKRGVACLAKTCRSSQSIESPPFASKACCRRRMATGSGNRFSILALRFCG